MWRHLLNYTLNGHCHRHGQTRMAPHSKRTYCPFWKWRHLLNSQISKWELPSPWANPKALKTAGFLAAIERGAHFIFQANPGKLIFFKWDEKHPRNLCAILLVGIQKINECIGSLDKLIIISRSLHWPLRANRFKAWKGNFFMNSILKVQIQNLRSSKRPSTDYLHGWAVNLKSQYID